MRWWYAVVGILFGVLLLAGSTKYSFRLYPLSPIGILVGLGLILGSLAYSVVWVGLIRGLFAVSSGLLGLFLIVVGAILDFSFRMFSIFFGLALIAGFAIYGVMWAFRSKKGGYV
jgi:hypothetical protein